MKSFNWINPAYCLPKDGQKVWVMLSPRQNRGTFLNSAMSIQIVCGVAAVYEDRCAVRNWDELGLGSILWHFKAPEGYNFDEPIAMAWIPVEDMPAPPWNFLD